MTAIKEGRFGRVILILLLAAGLVVVGCSRSSAPTASSATDHDMELWNPGPGDQIDGRDVPLLEPGYWEAQFGPAINPYSLPPRTAHIGPEGGIIHYGPHALIVPAGAVDSDITFSVENGSVTGVAADCGPGGLTFNLPVLLVMSYVGTQYQHADDPPDLHVYYMAPDGSLEQLPSVVDHHARTVTAELNHFSRYILG